MARATAISATQGKSPVCEYQVRHPISGSVRVITSCSLTEVRSKTSPSGEMKALNPVGDTCTTQRFCSMARSRDDATCWLCNTVHV